MSVGCTQCRWKESEWVVPFWSAAGGLGAAFLRVDLTAEGSNMGSAMPPLGGANFLGAGASSSATAALSSSKSAS